MERKPRWTFRWLLLAAVIIIPFYGGIALGESLITARGMVRDFNQRELQAPPRIKARLQALRQEIARKKWTFQVGYTAPLDYEIEQITGLREPADYLRKAREQNFQAGKILKKYPLPRISRCSASAPAFDWRRAGGSTAVRDQGLCGSSWAFGTHGALEGSYRAVDGLLVNSAEQDTLDCNPWGYSCAGGWWAFSYLMDQGSATEASYPYRAARQTCRSGVTRPYRAVNWGYVDDSVAIPVVADLKSALCKYGPLAVGVRVTPAFHAYTGGVFNEHAEGAVNHGVTLIGWNDGRKAWLIKNSWGTGWGETGGYGTERGYMWISYDSNRIGYAAAWTRATPKEACISFNPARAVVIRVGTSWKIMDGKRELFDFGADKAEADAALGIIRYYKINRSCSVGGPSPAFTYMMVSSMVPAGAMTGEDCIPFNPSTIIVKEIRGHWQIIDGSVVLYDFGINREEAFEAWGIIRKYGFNHSCFVRKPHRAFHYLRK